MPLRQSPLISPAALAQNPRSPNLLPLILLSRGHAPRRLSLSARLPRLLTSRCSLKRTDAVDAEAESFVAELNVAGGGADNRQKEGSEPAGLSVGIGVPAILGKLRSHRMSLGDQAFFLLAFIACTTSVAFASFVIAAIPTLIAMKRVAISLTRLADTAQEELPSTMAAIRLSGMEISDLTLELSDLSQEIADGINKSSQAVQAAEAGIRQIGSIAKQQTVSLIQERANLPDISLKPMVAGAAKKTSHVVGQAKKTLMSIISGGENNSEGENEDLSDKAEM
ncbi:uncharacterized protein LOC122016910 [Zingiber officinale]|uniref:Uncharacterized protein n=1 Tax=Zingiber officinale TaxID=94328 RepID=A0A8J5FBG6_ZINOF|nr:uncharacterized protein LOC122016910 [Zingiber officinale]KAG6484229.1 hypothetical protein ZIOFF_061024 [Zingiber officinale]